MCVRERESVCVCECVRECEEGVCVCVCESLREIERESVCVFVRKRV